MLFLHGFTGAPESGTRLREAMGARAEPWSALTLTGHGKAPAFCSFEEEVERIAGHPAKHAVAYSMGARIALAAAALRPGSFDSLVLVGVNPGLEDARSRQARVNEDEARAQRIEQEGLDQFLSDWERLPLFGEQYASAGARAWRSTIRRAHTAKGLAHALRATGLGAMPNLWPYLSTMETKMRFLYGEHDAKFAAIAARAAACNARATCHGIEGAYHDAILFNPCAVAQATLDP